MSKTYTIITFNPATGMEESVLVTKEVYEEFFRGIWRIKKNNHKYYSNTFPMSCLIGDEDDSEDEFHEYEDEDFNLEEMIIHNERLERLRFAMSQLTPEERIFIKALYEKEFTERALAAKLGVFRNTIHYQKTRILEKLKKFF